MRRHYADVLEPFWSPQVRYIEDGQRSLPFPFEEFIPPPFRLVQKWDMDRTAAHLGTWSASQRYRKETGRDPIGEIREELAAAWGDPSQEREVTWTLRLRVGMITGRGW